MITPNTTANWTAPLQCHWPEKDGCSVGPAQLISMNNCTGHGFANVITGNCDCESNLWKGGDCSLPSRELYNSSILFEQETTGPTWLSYFWPASGAGTAEAHLTVKTELPCDVYIGLGADSDPNTYKYDMVFKNVTQELHLDSKRLPSISGLAGQEGFAISLYIHGIENKTNKLLINHAGVSFTTEPVVTQQKAKIVPTDAKQEFETAQ